MPLSSTPTINPILSEVANEFFQMEGSFVGRRIAPVFNTGVPSGQYYVFDAENTASLPVLRTRAPGTEYDKMTIQLSDDTFLTRNYGVEIPVDDHERAKYSNGFNADVAAIRRQIMAIRYNEDLRIKALADSLSNTSAINPNWSATSTPRVDVEVAKNAIYDATGLEPNTIVMNRAVYQALIKNADIADRIQYTKNPFMLGTTELAQYFEIPNVIVAGALENTAAEGQAMSLSSMWGDDVLIAYVDPAQDLAAPNWARTFAWTQGGGQESVMSYRKEEIESDIHRVKQYVGEKVTGPDLAYLLTAALT